MSRPTYDAIVATHLTIDKAGRVVIPKAVREELQLEPGDSLEMESAGEAITFRPVRGTAPRVKEHGVWLVEGFSTLTRMRGRHPGQRRAGRC